MIVPERTYMVRDDRWKWSVRTNNGKSDYGYEDTMNDAMRWALYVAYSI